MSNTAEGGRFVDAFAWTALISSGMFATIGIFQAVAVWVLFPSGATPLVDGSNSAWGISLILDWFPMFIAGFVAFWGTVFAAALALRNRREWARVTFVWFSYVAVLMSLALSFAAISGRLGQIRVEGDYSLYLALVCGVMGMCGAAAFVWLAVRLSSAVTKREFVS